MLLIESINVKVSSCDINCSIVGRLLYYESKNMPIDLLLFGSEYSESKIEEIFIELKLNSINLPYIIISDLNKFELLNKLLNLGYYGYIGSPSELVILAEQINSIFRNIRKFRENVKQSTIGR